MKKKKPTKTIDPSDSVIIEDDSQDSDQTSSSNAKIFCIASLGHLVYLRQNSPWYFVEDSGMNAKWLAAAAVWFIVGYLGISRIHENPITKEKGAPYVYFSDELEFLDTEMSDYYWKKDSEGEEIDKPKDENDHAINALEYLLTHRPNIAKIVRTRLEESPIMKWHEQEIVTHKEVSPRYQF